MKHAIIAFLAAIASISYAELPDTLKDPATKEVVEYLDSKTTKSVNLASDFSNVNSTVTVAGIIDMGRERVSSGAGSTTSHTQSCTAGKKLLGGGCAITAGGVMIGSYPADEDTWQCSANASSTIFAYAICARVK